MLIQCQPQYLFDLGSLEADAAKENANVEVQVAWWLADLQLKTNLCPCLRAAARIRQDGFIFVRWCTENRQTHFHIGYSVLQFCSYCIRIPSFNGLQSHARKEKLSHQWRSKQIKVQIRYYYQLLFFHRLPSQTMQENVLLEFLALKEQNSPFTCERMLLFLLSSICKTPRLSRLSLIEEAEESVTRSKTLSPGLCFT